VDLFWRAHMQPPSRRGETYKIGVSGLLELLLGAVTDVGIYRQSVKALEGSKTR